MEALKSSWNSIQPIKGIHFGQRDREETREQREAKQLTAMRVTTLHCLMRSSPIPSQPASALTNHLSETQATTHKSREIPQLITKRIFSRTIVKMHLSWARLNLIWQFSWIKSTWMRAIFLHSNRLLETSSSRKTCHSTTWSTPTLQSSNHLPTSLTQQISRWFLNSRPWINLICSQNTIISLLLRFQSRAQLLWLTFQRMNARSSVKLSSLLLTRLGVAWSKRSWTNWRTRPFCITSPNHWLGVS